MIPQDTRPRWAIWLTDLKAAANALIINFPGAIAGGLLVFGPLGPSYAVMGAAAGLSGAIIVGVVPALLATSSVVVTTARIGEALVLATLPATLLTIPEVAADRGLIVVAVCLCVVLAGLWQIVFGLAGIVRIIKFTPHPVLIGFLNGVAVQVAVSPLKPFFRHDPATARLSVTDRPFAFALLLGVAALMLGFPAAARRLPTSWKMTQVPPVLIAFVGGIVGYYVLMSISGSLVLGPTLGDVHLQFLSPIWTLRSTDAWRPVLSIGWPIVSTSVVLAAFATTNSLMGFRSAQNLADVPVKPVRDLVAQGIGNCAAGLAGGLAGTVSPAATAAAYRAGGSTRLVSMLAGLVLLAASLLTPQAVASIPAIVLAGITVATGVLLFDRRLWGVVAEIRRSPSFAVRRRSLYEFAVIAIVMGITLFYSVLAGVIAGVVLSGMITIMNMSRPVIQRMFRGEDGQSKRVRPAVDRAILHDTVSTRAAILLDGMLFFGNAEDLATRVKELFLQADMIALDLRGVSDIDVTGAQILTSLAGTVRAKGKHLLFCSVPDSLSATVAGILDAGAARSMEIHQDLDAALEWMEERSLQADPAWRDNAEVLALRDIDFLSGLSSGELEQVAALVTRCEFAAGDTICREGDEGDRMWLLAKGSVSVRLISADGRTNQRLSSLACGTMVGEMALIDGARRSAAVIVDEHVVAYELLRGDYARLLSEYPAIAAKLLTNLSIELARRIRRSNVLSGPEIGLR